MKSAAAEFGDDWMISAPGYTREEGLALSFQLSFKRFINTSNKIKTSTKKSIQLLLLDAF
jgi:hypothetical protein